uniref:hypothetical protein n=1 Tax=Roseovarius indicus TaxID=540747 RepID=UPI003B527A92
MTKRTVIHVGLMKSGSTTIQKAVKSMRDVEFASAIRLKETQFEDLGRSRQVLENILDGMKGSRRFISHEALTYGRSRRCGQVLSEAAPDAHVLLVLRSPREYAKSLYRMAVMRRLYSEFPNKYLQDQLSPVNLARLQCDFAHFVERDAFHVLPFELLRDDASKFFSHVGELLSADFVRNEVEKANSSPDGRMLLPALVYNIAASSLSDDFDQLLRVKHELWYGKHADADKADAVCRQMFPEVAKRLDLEMSDFSVDWTSELAPIREMDAFQPYLREYGFVSELS